MDSPVRVALGICLLAFGCAHPAAPARSSSSTDGPELQGSFDKGRIREVIRGHLHEVQACYELALAQNRDLAGQLAMRFVVAPSGQVSKAELAPDSSLTDARLAECVAARIQTWKFPAPEGGGKTVVVYPFLLKPVDAASGATPEASEEATRRAYQAEFQRTVQANIPAVQQCFQAALSGAPDLSALLLVQLRLGPEGEVREAALAPRSKPTQGALVDCVLGQARGWKFPRPPAGPSTFVYPFLFTVPGRTTMQDAVEMVVQAHRDEIQRCYDGLRVRVPERASRRRASAPSGAVLARFVVEADGRVKSVTAAPDSPPSDPRLLECVAEGLRHARFPFAPGRSFAVDYAFSLEPSRGGRAR